MNAVAMQHQTSRTIELPLSRDYVRHWGVREAVKELIQNAIDSDSPFEYSFYGDTLTITSRESSLESRTLILGATSKADKADKIGSFGEGYKIALLVLTREGLPVYVRNGYYDWVPSFVHSENYGDEVLCITEHPAERVGQGLEFVIGGLSHQQASDIRDSCLLMQDEMDDIIETGRGNILPSRPGKLYVGGLFVCDTKLSFGYDMKPEYLKLERDRMTVSDFDVKWQAKDMWFSTKQWDRIAELMEANTPDLEYAEHGCPELVKEACFRQFQKNNPGAIAVSTQKEMEAAVAKGMTKTVYVGGGYYSALTKSASYEASVGHLVRVATPQEYLKAWAEQNQRGMSHPLRIAFRGVIAVAADWRLK
jgi:hypothetical protein